jgi:hypothetical protein
MSARTLVEARRVHTDVQIQQWQVAAYNGRSAVVGVRVL